MATLAPPQLSKDDTTMPAKPMVDGRKVLLDGKVLPWEGAVQEVRRRATHTNHPSTSASMQRLSREADASTEPSC